jgi:hypothetical protein
VNLSVIVGFRRDLAKIRLINGTSSEELITADIPATVNGWCRSNGSESDCAVPGPGLALMTVVAGVILLSAAAGWYFLKRKGTGGQIPPAP